MQPWPAWEASASESTFLHTTTTEINNLDSILVWEESSKDGAEGRKEVSFLDTLAVVAQMCHAMSLFLQSPTNDNG